MKNNSEEVSEHVCVEHQVNQATNVVLQDNIVAGFERVAYRINGEPCPGRTNSTEMIFILKQKLKKKNPAVVAEIKSMNILRHRVRESK